MYAAGGPHQFRDACREILELVVVQPAAFFTDVEVLQEIAHRYRSLNRRDEAHRRVVEFAGFMAHHIEPVYSFDVERSTELGLQHQRLSARDLFHLAVMERLGCTLVVSADKDFDGINSVRRLDPQRLSEWREGLGI